MLETKLRNDPARSGWYTPNEVQYLTSDGLNWRVISRHHIWRPPVDVFETDEALVVRVEVAGVRESDFEIALEGNILSIHGVRQDLSERRAYHQMEIRFGEFGVESRRFGGSWREGRSFGRS